MKNEWFKNQEYPLNVVNYVIGKQPLMTKLSDDLKNWYDAAVKTLSEKEQQALELCFKDYLPFAGVAKALGFGSDVPGKRRLQLLIGKAISKLRDNYKMHDFRNTKAPEPNWIPVMEKLPEEPGEYLVTAKLNDNVTRVLIQEYGFDVVDLWKGSKLIFENGGAFGDRWSDGLDSLCEVLAWMPLPEVYVGGESDERS